MQWLEQTIRDYVFFVSIFIMWNHNVFTKQSVSWNKANIRELRFVFASSFKLENVSNFTQGKQNYQNQIKYYGNQKEYIIW
jgi:hypothetical protein